MYLLRVTKQVKKWPEKRERKSSWVPVADAIDLVAEPGVVSLLQRFSELVKADVLTLPRGKDADIAISKRGVSRRNLRR